MIFYLSVAVVFTPYTTFSANSEHLLLGLNWAYVQAKTEQPDGGAEPWALNLLQSATIW